MFWSTLCFLGWGDRVQISEGLLCLSWLIWTHKEYQIGLWSLSLVWLEHKWKQGIFMKTHNLPTSLVKLSAYFSIMNLFFLCWSLLYLCHSTAWPVSCHYGILFHLNLCLNNSWGLDLFPAFLLSNCWPRPFSEMLLFWNRSLLFCPEASRKTGHVQNRDQWLYSSRVFMIFYNSQLIFS